MTGRCEVLGAVATAHAAWAYCALIVVLVIAAISDVRSGKIYNALTYPAIAAGLIGHTLFGGLTGQEQDIGLIGSIGGMAAGSVPMLAAWHAGASGGGDAKLMAAIGALTGWRFALATMFYGFVVAALMALFVMVRRRIVRRTLGRIWLFLLLTSTKNKPVDPAGPDSPKIPLGLALCIGSAAALIELMVAGATGPALLPGI